MLLFARRWREESRSTLGWLITFCVVTFMAFLFSMLFVDVDVIGLLLSEWLDKAPAVVRNMVGGDLMISANPSRFVSGMVFNTILPGLVLVYVCLSVTSIYTGEASQGNLEFLFSLPIKRVHLITGRILVFLANLALAHIAIYIGSIAGLLAAGEQPDPTRMALGMVNQFLLFATIGGLVFLISLGSNDRNKVLLITMALFFGLFVMNVFMEDEPLYINPFYYYDASLALAEGVLSWRNVLVLMGTAAASWLAGVRVYVGKQV